MNSVLDVNADNWEKEVLKNDILVVVDFWHERCPWCIILNPIFDKIAQEYRTKVKFVKLNVMDSPENQHIAVKYGIMGTPTLVFFCDGRPVEAVAGFQQKDNRTKLVDEVIEKHQECREKSTELKVS